jgi:hypothetical protein
MRNEELKMRNQKGNTTGSSLIIFRQNPAKADVQY